VPHSRSPCSARSRATSAWTPPAPCRAADVRSPACARRHRGRRGRGRGPGHQERGPREQIAVGSWKTTCRATAARPMVVMGDPPQSRNAATPRWPPDGTPPPVDRAAGEQERAAVEGDTTTPRCVGPGGKVPPGASQRAVGSTSAKQASAAPADGR
jgi:hypothetical protein